MPVHGAKKSQKSLTTSTTVRAWDFYYPRGWWILVGHVHRDGFGFATASTAAVHGTSDKATGRGAVMVGLMVV